jgi:hypothetical protein
MSSELMKMKHFYSSKHFWNPLELCNSDWGAYTRHLDPCFHTVSNHNTQKADPDLPQRQAF